MSKASKRAKSLLEQIADIADPRPKDFDIENAGVDDNAFVRAGSESEDEISDDEELKRDHYIDMGKSTLRRNQGIGQMGPKYVGSRVSRKDLYDGLEDSDEDLAEEMAPASSDDDMESDIGSDSEEAESNDDISAPVPKRNTAVDMDDSDSDSDSEGSESEAEVEDVAAGSRDRIRDEIRRLEEGEKALLKTITQTARSDVEKGQHAVNQTRLWEGALDARIRVQKLVTAANELPQYDLFSKLVEESCLGDTSAAEEDNCLENARQSVRLLLGSLVDLRRALVAQSPSVKQTQQEAISAQAGSKRNAMQALDDEDELAATWGELEELRGELQPYRDESLEKWSNKVQISSSVTATKKFKAVNQGIMHQIGQALAGKDRLIERTQLKRAEYKIIGKADEKEDNDESKNLSAAVDAHLKDRDVEIFDDTDFYQQLLRELIESRMVDSNDPTSSLGVRWAAVKQQSRAKKRTMDNKASKGRKIRYHVIEKLQSFMPPIPAGTWHEDMVNELFSSLLGQKVPQSILDDELDTFNSDPSKKSASEKALGQTGGVSVGSQGLRLFG
ncbi:rRNA-processing protein bfr2 [Coemansia sp. RSA 2337]|nr:rRNA-processing protein bfr2 [Coemansia sp. S3946]KAJ2467513.1 rRNA-processing protein bfr2 [Coemansia sp. RSA 2337]